ncbi:sigma-70-like protein [Streptomyces sp. PsTaAH-137]|nr:sigma-70-like protein [Streptomyces sp. PsTaAH-137]
MPVARTDPTDPADRGGGRTADAELHRRLVYGDEAALSELYRAYGGLVRQVAVRVTRTAGAADDVAQEVFAQLWARPYAFDARRGTGGDPEAARAVLDRAARLAWL